MLDLYSDLPSQRVTGPWAMMAYLLLYPQRDLSNWHIKAYSRLDRFIYILSTVRSTPYWSFTSSCQANVLWDLGP